MKLVLENRPFLIPHNIFSLYINGVVARLHEEKCGVPCGSDMVPGLLFADDTSLIASDREGLKRSLDVLVKWCEEWGVKTKCGKVQHNAYEEEGGGEM